MVEEPFPDEDALTEVELRQPPEAQAVRYNLITGLGLLIALASAGLYYFLYVGITELPETLPSVAHLAKVTGDVTVKRRGENVWKPGYEGMQLQLDDQVGTSSSSATEIAFSNGNVVRVQPSSIVLIGDLAQSPLGEEGMTAWHVEMGEVSFDVERGTEIVTANARALAASGSSGAIDAVEGGNTGIRIFRGSAQVTTEEGDAVTLTANEGVQVSPEGRAGPKLELPEPPTLLAPEHRAEILAEAQGASTRLSWELVERGVTYRVAVDYNVAEAELLLAAGLDQDGIEGDSRELAGLTPGSYFWRVAARNAVGMEGAFSKVSRFMVLAPPEAEELFVLFVDLLDVVGDVVHLRGRTGPGATVTVDGHPVNVSSDGRFSEFFKSGRPEVVIRATGADGAVAEERRALPVPAG